MNIYANDPCVKNKEIKEKGAIPVELEELYKISDVISFHCLLNDKTYHIVKDKDFSIMKEGVIIVNTSHRDLIEERSLIKYPKLGKIGRYAEDVVEMKQIIKENPLLKFKKGIILIVKYRKMKKAGVVETSPCSKPRLANHVSQGASWCE
jgi:phosphoglycerate dehydrogenase-like enzyme